MTSHAREQRVNPLYFEALAWQAWNCELPVNLGKTSWLLPYTSGANRNRVLGWYGLACENIRFSSLFAAGNVSRETSPAAVRSGVRSFRIMLLHALRAGVGGGGKEHANKVYYGICGNGRFRAIKQVTCSTGTPSSKYEHRRASALLRNIQNIRICMGKKPIVSVTYD